MITETPYWQKTTSQAKSHEYTEKNITGGNNLFYPGCCAG